MVTAGSAGGARVARDGRVLFTHHSLSQPPEVHTLESGGPRRLTHFTDEVMAKVALGEVRELRFEGAQGETVQMFVVMPPGAPTGKKPPLVHVIHGGPHGISGDLWHFRWNPQLFAAPGYVVATVNFQGSTSWGQDFAQRIQGTWGDRPYEDVMKATDLLIAAGLADSWWTSSAWRRRAGPTAATWRRGSRATPTASAASSITPASTTCSPSTRAT